MCARLLHLSLRVLGRALALEVGPHVRLRAVDADESGLVGVVLLDPVLQRQGLLQHAHLLTEQVLDRLVLAKSDWGLPGTESESDEDAMQAH